MEALKKTLFIIAVVSVTAYTVRHAYLKWFEPKESVLDKYADASTNDIKNAKSLEELDKLYARAHENVKAYEATHPMPESSYARDQIEPYKTESKVREAITEWEGRSREIYQLRFYWIVGFILVAGGCAMYFWLNRWIGLAAVIAGFMEKIYWTSPTFFGASGPEYERLLNNKISFSIITLLLLVLVGILTGTLKEKKLS